MIKTEYGEVEEPVPAGTVWQFNHALKGKSAAYRLPWKPIISIRLTSCTADHLAGFGG
jgi:hypothetical protein